MGVIIVPPSWFDPGSRFTPTVHKINLQRVFSRAATGNQDSRNPAIQVICAVTGLES